MKIQKLIRVITNKQNRRDRAYKRFFGEMRQEVEIVNGKAVNGYVVDIEQRGTFRV